MLQHVNGEPAAYTKAATTLEPRVYAASVVLNKTMLWLTGGSGHNSTEWINISVSANKKNMFKSIFLCLIWFRLFFCLWFYN